MSDGDFEYGKVLSLVNNVTVNTWCIHDAVKDIPKETAKLQGDYRAAWLLRAVSCIDLTTLAADDTRSNVVRMCFKAMSPLHASILDKINFPRDKLITTAAVCVYPARVGDAARVIQKSACTGELNIAAVATGFPSGQYGLESRLLEIKYAVNEGATEIDVVIDRSLVLAGKWDVLFHELKEMKKACGQAEMKTILATGELGTFRNIYKASMIAMFAGSDFIKTSTGKEVQNATLPVGLVMMRAIRRFHRLTGRKVGFKAAGGIRTAEDALNWLVLVKRELGNEWLNKKLFRIGASALLADIEKKLYHLVHGKIPPHYELMFG